MRVGFIVTAVSAGANWLGLQVEESAIVHNCRIEKALHVTNVGKWSYVTVGGDLDGVMFGASDLELENFGMGKTSGW